MGRRLRQTAGSEYAFAIDYRSVQVSDTFLAINAELELYQNDSCTSYASAMSTAEFLDSLWEVIDVLQFVTFDRDCGVDPGDTARACLSHKSLYRWMDSDSS